MKYHNSEEAEKRGKRIGRELRKKGTSGNKR
jgi:hypothetical protein